MKHRLYIATVSQEAPQLAAEYGIGLELDHYCTAINMEEPLAQETHRQVMADIRQALGGSGISSARGPAKGESLYRAEATELTDRQKDLPLLFHAPFNELCPAAIDPKIRDIAFERYEQSYFLSRQQYGIRKMIVHSGYMPHVYYKVWHHEKSVEFWKRYMENKPKDFTICIENVLEDEPHMMVGIAEELDQINIRLCLDIGHANCMSSISPEEWIRVMGPYLSHLHIHNNDGTHDQHRALQDGTVNMGRILELIDQYCGKDTTITIESLDGRKALEWLDGQGYLR